MPCRARCGASCAAFLAIQGHASCAAWWWRRQPACRGDSPNTRSSASTPRCAASMRTWGAACRRCSPARSHRADRRRLHGRGAGDRLLCDIRIAAGARFGAPIAHLGFPWRPRGATGRRRGRRPPARDAAGGGAARRRNEARGFLQRVVPENLALEVRHGGGSPTRAAGGAHEQAHAAAVAGPPTPRRRACWAGLRLRHQRRAPRGHLAFLEKPLASSPKTPTPWKTATCSRRCAPPSRKTWTPSPSRPTPACLQLARPGARHGDDRQPAGLAGHRAGRAHRGAGGEVGRGHDAVPGHAARRLRVPAAQHRLPEGGDRILRRQRRAGGGGVQPGQLRLGEQDRLPGRHAARVHAGRRPQRLAAGARGPAVRPAPAGAAATTTSRPSSTPAAPPAAARARCSRTATCCPTRGAQELLGLAAEATC